MPVVGEVKGRYNPFQVEEEVKTFWRQNAIYRLVRQWRRGRKRFLFLDGPPYPSSDVPHAGTAWNKVLKDTILRYKRMKGYDVLDRPGYDCHGLPIEVAVERKLGIKVKREIETRIGVERFIEECKRFAETNIKGLTKWFQELGVFMDWDNPYLTMTDDYIEAAWWLIKKAHEKGLLALEKRVVYWCPRCSTTLAEYETEYRELEDPSIYVKFPVEGRENEYIVIWTTTPWTLVANTFVMVHPDANYVRVKVGNEVYIVAEQRLKHVMEEIGVKDYHVLEKIEGKKLVGLRYKHPLEDIIPLQSKLKKYHVVVAAPEYVTLYEGTGLVHAAPGHGFEDFGVARRIGIPEEDILAPVDDEGRFTSEAGKYAGLYIRDASKQIIEDLRQRGYLLHEGRIRHRYPVCWRCKTPVLLRATRQWVIKVSRLKHKLLEESERVKWIPSWGVSRLRNLLENLQDWVISRQRYWGTPLPIWRCERCGYTLVVGSRDEIAKYGGKVPKELHRPWIDQVVLKCPRCGGPMKRVPDVVDVWLDSGVAFYAIQGHPEKTRVERQVDFITEGHDQLRGWFFSLLRSGVIGFDASPYKTVLIHGFMLDEKGREMHKSLGNYVGTDDIVKKVGRDVFRLWILQNTVWEDARFSWKGLEEVKADLSVAWNVFVFASTYMRLDNFNPRRYSIDRLMEKLRLEDRWILSRLQRLVEEVTRALESYHVHEAARMIRQFIVEDVSRWYIRLIRRRVWVEEETEDKIAAYVTLYTVLKTWLTLAAPFIPFFTEKLYQSFVKPAEPDLPPSIHMNDWPNPRSDLVDVELENAMNILREFAEAVAAARMKAGLKLRQPIRQVIVYTDNAKAVKALEMLRELALLVANSYDVKVKPLRELGEVMEYEVELNYSRVGPRYKKLTKTIERVVAENANYVGKTLIEKGEVELEVEGVKVVLTREDVIVKPRFRTGLVGKELEWGTVVIDTTLGAREIAEGIARDIVRRIQFMRKELDLKVDEYIDVAMYVPSDHVDYVKQMLSYIKSEVRAKTIAMVDDPTGVEGELVRDWVISGAEYRIGIKRSAG